MNKTNTSIAIDFARNIAGYKCDSNGKILNSKIPNNVNIYLSNISFLMEEVVVFCDNKKLLLLVTYCPARKKFSACLSKFGKIYKKFTEEEQAIAIMKAVLEVDKKGK